ncbi:MAG TPA: hypothetical protein VER96_22945 [Polyangiaceae bacterium]|nr:hypothetical protein [Polyangiaceae bacterium]
MRLLKTLCLAIACTGCGGAGDRTASVDPFAAAVNCSSNQLRSINESEGEEMGPGRACLSCHADSNAATGENDAPIFAFAGTVYPSAHEPIDCVASASEGAEIEITDADGRVFTRVANHSGNFFDEPPAFSYPYRAKLRFRGRERIMVAPQMIGDCNSCHTEKGDAAAPGRILLP